MKLIAAFLMLAAAIGCDGKKVFQVTGTVTYGDKPLPAGVVWFDPDPGKGNDGPQGFAYVKDGAFDSKQKGRGVMGGGYIIRVEGFDGKPGNELPLGKPLFVDYQEKRDLPKGDAQVQIEVALKKKS